MAKQGTTSFWYQFVMADCFAYLALYTGICNRNWHLCTGSLKLMASVFHAFDRPISQRLIPQHLMDLARMPQSVLQHLVQGGFSVRLSATEWHAVALDKCHEMCINKDAKLALLRLSVQKMEHTSHYLQFRASCINNLKVQLFPEQRKHKPSFSHKPSSKDKISDNNIKGMRESIEGHGMFSISTMNQGLWNFLDNIQATPEQSRDLLTFRQIGQSSFEEYISSKLLKQPSTQAPVQKKKLSALFLHQKHKKRVEQVEKERKLSQRLLKRQLSLIAKHGGDINDPEMFYGPISPLPSTLVDANGLPYKASKSNTTTYLQKRYNSVPVIIVQTLPPSWIPDTTVLEGMFTIQTPPLPIMEQMQDYVKLLLTKYVKPYLVAGAEEVHVVFDNPGSLSETPKELEHVRRDKDNEAAHQCLPFESSLPIPDKWRSILACRNCKKNLTQIHSC